MIYQALEEESKGWIASWKKNQLKVRELNDRLMMAERAFTDRDGLFGMSWYKHLVTTQLYSISVSLHHMKKKRFLS